MEPQYEVRNALIEKQLDKIGRNIRGALEGSGYGFVLLIASFGAEGNTFYTSNCNRQDVCNMMREFIAKHEPH
jgi:hypothetical protein